MDLNCSGSLKWKFLKIKIPKGNQFHWKKVPKKMLSVQSFGGWSVQRRLEDFTQIWWRIWASNEKTFVGVSSQPVCFSRFIYFSKKMRIMDYIHFLVCLVGYSYNPIFVICLNIPISKISDHRICGWRPRVSTTGFLVVRGGHSFIFSTMLRELFCNWKSTHNSQTIKLQLFF